MKKDLLERLEEYCGADYVPLHMPGSKKKYTGVCHAKPLCD